MIGPQPIAVTRQEPCAGLRDRSRWWATSWGNSPPPQPSCGHIKENKGATLGGETQWSNNPPSTEARAHGRYIRGSVSKVRRVLDRSAARSYRGRLILLVHALPLTNRSPRCAASGMANAENNLGLTPLADHHTAIADMGPSRSDFRPPRPGRAFANQKQTWATSALLWQHPINLNPEEHPTDGHKDSIQPACDWDYPGAPLPLVRPSKTYPLPAPGGSIGFANHPTRSMRVPASAMCLDRPQGPQLRLETQKPHAPRCWSVAKAAASKILRRASNHPRDRNRQVRIIRVEIERVDADAFCCRVHRRNNWKSVWLFRR